MKAAAHHSRCAADAAPSAHAGMRPRLLTSHLPKRHTVPAHCAPEQPVSPRLTATRKKPARPPAAHGPANGPRVLHIDCDLAAAVALAALLVPEACVIHVRSVAEAKDRLAHEIFSLVVIDPSLPDGDAASLLPAMVTTPVLVYSANTPEWRDSRSAYAFLPKPWTSHRELWSVISGMLGISHRLAAGD